MKPSSTPTTGETLPSILTRPDSAESGYQDSCGPNIYAFQEAEDASGSRSRGYQKPKQMWIAKDQALTEQSKNGSSEESNLSGSAATLSSQMIQFTSLPDFNPHCFTQSTLSHPVSHSQSVAASPPRAGYLGCSPSTTGSAPCTAAALSSSLTNTSSSLSSHTPPPCVHGMSNTGSVSSCGSPSPGDPHYSKIGISTDYLGGAVSDSNIKLEPSAFKENTKPMHRKNLAGCRRQRNFNEYVHEKDTRRRKSARSSTKLKENLVSVEKLVSPAPITLTLNLSALTSSTSCKPRRAPTKVRYSTTVPSCVSSLLSPDSSLHTSCAVGSGLKIRLRRDPTLPSKASKVSSRSRSKSDISGTFRIVESWCDADAPGGEVSRRTRISTANASSPASSIAASTNGTSSTGCCGAGGNGFHVGDIVWAKLAGYPYWPSRINALWARNLHQLCNVPVEQQLSEGSSNSTSLAVASTPNDPSLAAGFTARVDWLAWDQCSYLSCSKLYPFVESFDRLYNPRTRVKGYTDAVRLAKRLILDKTNSINLSCISGDVSHTPHVASEINSLGDDLTSTAAPSAEHISPGEPPIDPQPSAASITAVPLRLDATHVSNIGILSPLSSASRSLHLTSHSTSVENVVLRSESDLPEVDCSSLSVEPIAFGSSGWAPLPQLDISGFGDFHASHIPTFSEDEDDAVENLANKLRIPLSPSM
ncbi:unnamed protein product [Protopolystoma xenopodis]|uniref:PWWP domain-containing protein n=1 Tax=Protopolystoma xenopodis TaxID=117903 RepID=A0A3S5A4U1_9PLAT|nr:unnamed protein product [Protopolystoma xenopodis]